MPYEGEFAKHGILRDFENNPLITEMLEDCDVLESENMSLPKSIQKLKRNSWMASQVFAIDGSHRPIKVRNGYPGASAGFLSVATVMIDMEKLAREVSELSINPVTFADVEKAYATTGALPSSNVVRKGFPDSRSSFRFSFYKLLEKTRPIEHGESLLGTYNAILELKPPTDGLTCPLGELCQHDKKHPTLATGKCACGSYDVYPTDQLRIHERFYDNAPNGESIGEARSLMEHLTLLNYLRHIEKLAESDARFWEIFVSTGFMPPGSASAFYSSCNDSIPK
jgi:hypothetical protein